MTDIKKEKDEELTTIKLDNLTEDQEAIITIFMFEGALRYKERLIDFLNELGTSEEYVDQKAYADLLEKIKKFPVA
jgi:hypothetical protein